MKTIKQTKVRLFFPNTGHEYIYTYPHDMEHNRMEESVRQWYEEHAHEQFALYGYGPMDIDVWNDNEHTAGAKVCYQETYYACYYNEQYDDPWFGRWWHFYLSLGEYRYRMDQEQLKQAS